MDEDELPMDQASKLRSRLHVRAGKKLLDHDKLTHAIGTLYDAIEYAMRWKYLQINDTINKEVFYDPISLYNALNSVDLFSMSSITFPELDELMEHTLEDGLPEEFEKHEFWSKIKQLLTELGVFPFKPDDLPPEDDKTRNILDLEGHNNDPEY